MTLLPRLAELTSHHRHHCAGYDRILSALGVGDEFAGLTDLPWLPVRLFKTHVLKSISDEEVFTVLSSSGTSGSGASRIHLDRAAAAAQTRHLAATLRTVLGTDRLPMLIVDTVRVTKARSARAAGVLGMSTFGRAHTYLLGDDEIADPVVLRRFLARHGDEPFLIFGFTFLVWQHLYALARDHRLDLSNGILIHSGGWKKLADRAVGNARFRAAFAADTGLTRIHAYYGMVEQIGTIHLEGPSGNGLYCPDFADVVIRDPETWREQPVGKPGLIEVLSTLPTSYPGHALLTEDLGVCHGIDDGDRPGKRFSVLGRLPKAEARGCSDTIRAA